LRYLALVLLSLVLLAPVPALADSGVSADTYSASPPPVSAPAPTTYSFASGIPEVTGTQFVGILGGLATKLYEFALAMSPYVLLAVFGLLLFGFLFRPMLRMAIFAVIGFVVVWLAPMMVGVLEHVLHH